MNFKLSQEKETFLRLAMKKIAGTATTQEGTQLAALIDAAPDLKQHYYEMSHQLKLAQDEGFMELYLRVLFNKASGGAASRTRRPSYLLRVPGT